MKSCIICGGSYAASTLSGLLSCQSCSFTTADLTLGREELRTLYDDSYFCGDEYRDYVAERPIIEKTFVYRLKHLLPHIANPSSKHLFEIGTAYGFFLSLCRPAFGTVEGVDISGQAARFAAQELQVPVAEADFLDYMPANPIDVACMWDTIEHVARPDLYIEKLARLMQRGSILAITTGDIDSVVARWRGRKWRQIHPPTHLHYFSTATLTHLLGNYGFCVREYRYDGSYRTLDTIAYIILNKKHNLPRLYRTAKWCSLLKWYFRINLGDIVYVIAVKD
jgi:hypothetical protein